ncbi:hexosaminidase D-like isoform X2 [Choristoneura fumiferana]|uniref:hexosaminidase D-like isoform X2 n=1 Tax=Choristoneura fumiferana TaxID=7141 RepID=UPI003D15DABC
MGLFSFIFKMRSVKMKMFVVITLILVIYLIVSYVLLEKWYTRSQKDQDRDSLEQKWNITLQYVVVHLDLKGSPPLLSYLQSILKQLKDHGTTALLMEYEDMFPFEGALVNLTARNCYKKDELKEFLTFAVQMGLEIIPLVQTFGHMEYALKLREFQHLREDPKYPDSICPSANESQELIREILRQVIQFHSTIAPLKHIHIGFDEVYQFRVCDLCFQKKTKLDVLLSHVKFISGVIWDLSPKTTILTWEDMFKGIRPTHAIDLRFPNMESVCWDYAGSTLDTLHPNLYMYQRMFDNQWVASAYKGADGSTRTIPNLYKRFENHLHWLNFIMTYESIYKLYRFKGIILTGWSRYSHMEPPCELLPVAMPSLLLNLILIEKYHKGIFYKQELNKSSSQRGKNIEKQRDQHQQEYINNYIANDLNSALMCENCIVDGSLSSFQAHTCVFEGSALYAVLERSG